MRKISFVISLIGIILLFSILNFSSPIKINSQDELSSLKQNQKVIISGKVIKQTAYSIKLDNNLSALCENCPDYKNKTISIIGSTNKYQNKTEIKSLEIK